MLAGMDSVMLRIEPFLGFRTGAVKRFGMTLFANTSRNVFSLRWSMPPSPYDRLVIAFVP
jgi:hypothetical protein